MREQLYSRLKNDLRLVYSEDEIWAVDDPGHGVQCPVPSHWPASAVAPAFSLLTLQVRTTIRPQPDLSSPPDTSTAPEENKIQKS